MSASAKTATFVMNDGERYSLLVDRKTGLPLYYPNLFITTQVRNRSLSLSSMNSSLAGIKMLLQFMAERGENIDARFAERRYLTDSELDGLRDFCQQRHITEPKVNVTQLSKNSNGLVGKNTEYTRLTVIAEYIDWLALTFLTTNLDRQTTTDIRRMSQGLKARRPPRKRRNVVNEPKGLTVEQIEIAFEVFRPGSYDNPFSDLGVQKRNRLIFLLLYHLGLRGGELLNIRIRDFDFQTNQLLISRRADESDDPRTYQPLVKTVDRVLPIKDTLIKEVHSYILKERKAFQSASKHDYLLITHKNGLFQGQPLSISGYKRVIKIVKEAAPDLYRFTGHQLRHTWNENFSRIMDAMDEKPSQEKQEQIRSYLMGWRNGSGTAATYNKRFIVEKAHEAALKQQDGLVRVPEGLSDG